MGRVISNEEFNKVVSTYDKIEQGEYIAFTKELKKGERDGNIRRHYLTLRTKCKDECHNAFHIADYQTLTKYHMMNFLKYCDGCSIRDTTPEEGDDNNLMVFVFAVREIDLVKI